MAFQYSLQQKSFPGSFVEVHVVLMTQMSLLYLNEHCLISFVVLYLLWCIVHGL